jgi:hypothetical protein
MIDFLEVGLPNPFAKLLGIRDYDVLSGGLIRRKCRGGLRNRGTSRNRGTFFGRLKNSRVPRLEDRALSHILFAHIFERKSSAATQVCRLVGALVQKHIPDR